MTVSLEEFLPLARYLTQRRALEDLLVVIVEHAAALLRVRRASIRILDHERRMLVATCRAGEPLFDDPRPFALGEGLIGWVAANEAVLRLNEPESDSRFVARQGAKEPMGAFLGVPLVAGAGCLGVLSFVATERSYFQEDHESVALLLAAMTAPHLEVARLARLSNLDPLTGLLNRRGLDAAVRSAATEPTYAAVMVDIDHFKVVNDTYGHDAGDRVLRLVADTLASTVRRGDSVARSGGEEFVLLLHGANLETAQRIAERARERLERSRVDIGGKQVGATASFGVAEARPNEAVEDVVKRADAAMYEAKRGGRNRVSTRPPG